MDLSDIRGILIALAIVIILFAAGMVGHYALNRAFGPKTEFGSVLIAG
jgi:hypothetical protein